MSSDAKLPPSADLPIPAGVAERAVEWLLDLQAPDASESLQQQWQRWRTAHPDHERAWQRIESVNGKLRHLAGPTSTDAVHAALEGTPSRKRRKLVQTLTLLLFGSGTAWLVPRYTPWREWTADTRTASGEHRQLTLDDGTVLHLNTDSAVDIRYGENERRLSLIRGELLIETAKDTADRPFRVSTEHGTMQALGTRFSVQHHTRCTELAVYDGAVHAMPAVASVAVVVRAGEKVSFTKSSIDPITAADEDALAWTQGMLIAKGMRLADLLAELDRYTARSLSCTPDIADLRVSGSYPLRDIDALVQGLATMLSLCIETITRPWGREATLLSRDPSALSHAS